MRKKWLLISLTVIALVSLLVILEPALASNESVTPSGVNTGQNVVAESANTIVDPIQTKPLFTSPSQPGLSSVTQFAMSDSNYNMFLKIDGIPGESSSPNLEKKEWIELLAFDWGLSQPARVTGGPGIGIASGRTQFSDFSFSHLLDLASPLLMSACAQGKFIDTATLQLWHTGGGTAIEFYEFKMTSVMVTSVNLSGSYMVQEGVPTIKPVEKVALTFAKAEWKYWQGTTNGDVGGGSAPVTGSYDLRLNRR